MHTADSLLLETHSSLGFSSIHLLNGSILVILFTLDAFLRQSQSLLMVSKEYLLITLSFSFLTRTSQVSFRLSLLYIQWCTIQALWTAIPQNELTSFPLNTFLFLFFSSQWYHPRCYCLFYLSSPVIGSPMPFNSTFWIFLHYIQPSSVYFYNSFLSSFLAFCNRIDFQ